MPEHQQMQQSGKPDSTFQKQAALASQTQVSHPASIIQRARIDPKSLTTADVLQLQRTIGNRAVGRLLSEIRNSSKVQQVPIQRQEVPEEEKEPLQGMFGKEPEEETCPSCVQRQEKPEEEEPLQGKFETIQRLEPEEEEKLQMKSVVQRQESPEEEEPIQGKMIGTIQRQEIPEEEPLQPKRENNTGMPDNLKAGVESISGIDMSDVRVHYNSDKPAQVGALAYTQGTNIHVAPGQERHLPHEAWHVVQQAQGRVSPTMQMKEGVLVNDDIGLEREADIMCGKVVQMSSPSPKRRREDSVVVPVPPVPVVAPPVVGTSMVTKEVALEILKNSSMREPPFRPDLGLGGVSWFVTAGNPHTGIDPSKTIQVPVILTDTQGAIIFNEGDLIAIHTAKMTPELYTEITQQVLDRKNAERAEKVPPLPRLERPNSAMRGLIQKSVRKRAERLMWLEVAQRVRDSEHRIGVVNLPPNGQFSHNQGQFTIVADPSKISLQEGGPEQIIHDLEAQGVDVPPDL